MWIIEMLSVGECYWVLYADTYVFARHGRTRLTGIQKWHWHFRNTHAKKQQISTSCYFHLKHVTNISMCKKHVMAKILPLFQPDRTHVHCCSCYECYYFTFLLASYVYSFFRYLFLHSCIVAHPMMLQRIAGLKQNNRIYPWTEEIWAFSGALRD